MVRILPVVFILATSSLTLTGLSVGDLQMKILSRAPDGEQIRSLSGVIDADDGGNLRIAGEDFQGPPSKFGSMAVIKDLDKDGIDDLAITCPNCPGTDDVNNGGRIYIWFGGNIKTNGTLDLEEERPPLIIYGGHIDSELGSAIDSGDINGDGHIDLVLGVSRQPECGRAYIVWGKDGGFSGDLYLPDVDRYEPNGNPLGFLNTPDYSIIGSWMKPVPAPFSNYLVGDSLAVDDLDGDGNDDLVVSTPGWNNVSIVWGTSLIDDFGDHFTQIYDIDSGLNNGFGKKLDLGDLDGDGDNDLVISHPRSNGPSGNQFRMGSLFTFFDPGDLKTESLIFAQETGRPVIWGVDPYDNFGSHLEIVDINGDGKEDILVGSPGSDGSKNDRENVGAINIFLGDQENGFPKTITSEDSYITIHGEITKSGDEPGDGIGWRFSTGDINGDGKEDLVLGIPGRDNQNGYAAGETIGIDGRTAFPSGGGEVSLEDMDVDFIIRGISQEFGMGSSVSVGDLNGDGVDDLVSTAPFADGPDMDRPGCGESFVYYGSGISVGDLKLSGRGSADPYLLLGNGNTVFNFTVMDNRFNGTFQRFRMELESGGSMVEMELDGQGNITNLEGQDMILEMEEENITRRGKRVNIIFNVTLDWFSTLQGETDLRFEIDISGKTIYRDYPNRFTILKDVELKGIPDIRRDGEPITAERDWFRSGETISFSGMESVYQRNVDQMIECEGINITLSMEGDIIDHTFFQKGWELSHIVPDMQSVNYSLYLTEAGDNKWKGDKIPDLGKPVEISVMVDRIPPSGPGEIHLLPDGDRIYGYDDDLQWSAKWNNSLKNNTDTKGSGIFSYEVKVDDGSQFYASEKGGLWGSYFSDRDFNSNEISKMDREVDFDWGQFSPNSEFLPPKSFSIRWHGWIRAPDTRAYRFSLGGSGEAKMIIGEEMIFDFKDIQAIPITPGIEMTGGGLTYVELLYRPSMDPLDRNSIELLWDGGSGSFETIPSSILHYPSNSTDFDVETNGPFNISVRSVNWVGITSEWRDAMGIIDTEGPRVDFTISSRWYGSSKPDIRMHAYDVNIGSRPGSGLNPSGIFYRLREEGETSFTQWYEEGVRIEYSGQEMERSMYTVVSSPVLDSAWRGRIQWKLSDMVGNEYLTSELTIGVDTDPPGAEVVFPDINLVQKRNEFTATILFEDGDGSGVAGSSLEWRYKNKREAWSNWMDMSVNDTNLEIYADLPINLPNGVYEIQFRSSDLVGNRGVSDNLTMIIDKPPENEPPKPNIYQPRNESRIPEGILIDFDATGTTDDGISPLGYLDYTWFSSIDGFLGKGKNISSYLSLGNHTITLYVYDGEPGNNVSTYIILEVFEIEQPDGNGNGTEEEGNDDDLDLVLLMIGIMLVIILLTIGVYGLVRYRSKSEQETRIGYREMSEDDYDYEKRLKEEERKLGLRDDDEEKDESEIKKEREELYG